ncbi:putative secreted protein [Mycobacteroides abscessus subsp. abscessus]|nr:putative secreted protein [Mycobacteroides abscessus subsp. abscessus]
MSKFSGALAALAVSALPVATLVAAPAEAAGTSRQTLMSRTYTCDRQPINYMKFRFPAVPTAEITSDGRTATAHIEMLDGARNAQYTVRLIPAPHASLGCLPGDPSIATGALSTDGFGNGSSTVQLSVAPGTSGVWVAVDLPQAHSQSPAEFYSSDFVASV